MASLNDLVLIVKRLSVLLSNQQPSEQCYMSRLLETGLFTSLMLRMHFFMVILKKPSTCINHLVLLIHLHLIMCVCFSELSMASNKRPEPGTIDLLMSQRRLA
ncbi:unnamed protein product [Brassica rapa subsp. trilocularis]